MVLKIYITKLTNLSLQWIYMSDIVHMDLNKNEGCKKIKLT